MSELNFTHSNGNKVKLTTPDTLAGNRTFKLPNADGSAGQVLQTDGNGNLSFVDLPVASLSAVIEPFAIVVSTVANESAPDPSVFKNCPVLPSAPGNLKVLFAAKVSGVANLTLLPFECVKFSSLKVLPPSLSYY